MFARTKVVRRPSAVGIILRSMSRYTFDYETLSIEGFAFGVDSHITHIFTTSFPTYPH